MKERQKWRQAALKVILRWTRQVCKKWLFFVVELQKKTRRRGLWLIAHVTGDVAEVRVVESTRKRDKTFSRCASCPNLRAIALSTAAVCHANALA